MDPVVLHGFMAMVAAMHKLVVGWDDNTAIDFHRFHAVKQTNTRLTQACKDNVTTTSDELVMAVSMLVNTEVSDNIG
jgi:hypothetical protein